MSNTSHAPRVLLVEDDHWLRTVLQERLSKRGFLVDSAATAQRARELMESCEHSLMLLDLMLPDADGLQLIGRARAQGTRDVIVISGHGDVGTVSSVFRSGAVDFLSKPLDLVRLDGWLTRAAARHERTSRHLVDEAPLIGESEPFRALRDALHAVAASREPVVLHGDTGVGKSRLARELHRLGSASHGRLVVVQAEGCSAAEFVRQLEAGGMVVPSDPVRPTLLVEEFTLLSPTAQAALAAAVDTERGNLAWAGRAHGDFARVLLTTTADPFQEADRGRLGSDLWLRLEVGVLHVPPLADRGRDVVALVEDGANRERPGSRLSPEVADQLMLASWPGNVRQALAMARRAAQRAEGLIRAEHLGLGAPEVASVQSERLEIPVGTSLEDARRQLVLATLRSTRGDKARAAEILGISLKTLYNRIREYRAK
ncbi:MAG: response regulator [Planctomycetota bacterium]